MAGSLMCRFARQMLPSRSARCGYYASFLSWQRRNLSPQPATVLRNTYHVTYYVIYH